MRQSIWASETDPAQDGPADAWAGLLAAGDYTGLAHDLDGNDVPGAWLDRAYECPQCGETGTRVVLEREARTAAHRVTAVCCYECHEPLPARVLGEREDEVQWLAQVPE